MIPTPTFSWSAVQGSSRYELRVDRTDIVQNRLIDRTNLTTNSFTASTALSAGTYRFWVRAVSVTGEFSPWSLISNFTLVAIEEDPHPLANLGDAPILTVSPAILRQAATRQPEPKKVSHLNVATEDQHSTSNNSDTSPNHHPHLGGDHVVNASNNIQLNVRLKGIWTVLGSDLGTGDTRGFLIDEVMSSSEHVWWE